MKYPRILSNYNQTLYTIFEKAEPELKKTASVNILGASNQGSDRTLLSNSAVKKLEQKSHQSFDEIYAEIENSMNKFKKKSDISASIVIVQECIGKLKDSTVRILKKIEETKARNAHPDQLLTPNRPSLFTDKIFPNGTTLTRFSDIGKSPSDVAVAKANDREMMVTRKKATRNHKVFALKTLETEPLSNASESRLGTGRMASLVNFYNSLDNVGKYDGKPLSVEEPLKSPVSPIASVIAQPLPRWAEREGTNTIIVHDSSDDSDSGVSDISELHAERLNDYYKSKQITTKSQHFRDIFNRGMTVSLLNRGFNYPVRIAPVC
ncbi:MAG: hypothetical protein WCB03_19295 [Rouxiella badensis]|uniref:hypothetical protein n=1 Tax=Rouxiella badensis TaxID=1646377 RepID=UPI003C52D7DC